MKRKIFFRFFSVTFVAVALMFVVGVAAVNANADALMKSRIKEETELVCSLVREQEDFDNFAKYESSDAFRITVIDLAGNVLYESDTKAPLENHAGREEIKNALNGTPAAVKRYSETFGCDMTYYAMKNTLSNGSEVVVRIAVKSSEINEYLGVSLPILVVVLIAALAVSLVVSGVLSKNVASKVSEIAGSLKTLNEGCYVPIKTDSSEPELFAVLSEINELSEATHERICKISEEHDKLNTLLTNVSQGIVAVDGSEKIVFANKNVSKIFDCFSDLIDKPLIYLVDDATLYAKIQKNLGCDCVFEWEYKGKDLSVALRKTELAEKDETISIVIITDVTGEKALQKQKSDFFANASHELKTPVTVMQGLSEILLSNEGLEQSERKKLERIHAESLRLSALISDMLKLSRLENGRSEEGVSCTVDLKKTVEEAIAELEEEIVEKNLSVEVAGEGFVFADGARIFEIAHNLISNAVHYNKQNGSVKVEIASEETRTLLRVSDTGIGIEKQNIPRLCERFYRVDKSRSKKTGGTGLGLAIVKHVCAIYNAELVIESEFGKGTSVQVAFNKG